MWHMIIQMANNVGVSLEWIILLLILLGGGIFYAKNFQIGIMLHFVGTGCAFMMFYALDLNYTPALILFFMSLVIMTLSLWASSKVAEKGGLT